MPSNVVEDVNSHAGTLGLTDLEGSNPEARNHPDSSRSYGGSMAHRYKNAIFGGFVMLVFLVAAIVMSAASLRRSGNALALATANADDAKTIREKMNAYHYLGGETNDAPPLPDPLPPSPDAGGLSPTAIELAPAALRVTPFPTQKPTSTPEPTAPRPTDAPTEPHPLNLQWFHRDHADYQAVVNNDANAGLHPYYLAGNFCHRQSLLPCEYHTYCPNGKGNPPFGGGPPRREGWEDRPDEQWSPMPLPTTEGWFGWVQVGSIPVVDGGIDGNRCWSWDEWEYHNGANFLVARGEEHQQWILCCERAAVKGGGAS